MLVYESGVGQADRLVRLVAFNPSQGIRSSNVSAADFSDWQRDARSFDGLAAFVGDRSRDFGVLRLCDRRREREQRDKPASKHGRYSLETMDEGQHDPVGRVFEALRGAREVIAILRVQRRLVR